MKPLKTFISTLAIAIMPLSAMAQNNDFGMQYSIGGSKKIDKQLNIGAELEMRTRNNSRTVSRWSGEAYAQYKIASWLKAGASYKLMSDRREERIKYSKTNSYDESELQETVADMADMNNEGIYQSWRPSYFTIRHRVSVSLTGSVDVGRFSMSLRERWQYTYRPEKETDQYSFGNEAWEKTTVRSKSNHVLRSRFQVEYNIPKCKFNPYASVELFNSMALEKTRLTAGVEYKLKKKHVFNAFYRYQSTNNDSDEDSNNMHIIGLGYQYKF